MAMSQMTQMIQYMVWFYSRTSFCICYDQAIKSELKISSLAKSLSVSDGKYTLPFSIEWAAIGIG